MEYFYLKVIISQSSNICVDAVMDLNSMKRMVLRIKKKKNELNETVANKFLLQVN